MKFLVNKLSLSLPIILGALLFLGATAGASDQAPPQAHGAKASHANLPHIPVINWTDLGYASKDAQGGELDRNEAPMAPPLLFAILNFAIFASILYFKAGPALTKYLANRHEAIKNALEEAAKLQEQAKEKLKEYSARIADADKEVNALIKQIRKDAEDERTRLVAEAERQAERMKKDAEARIESEFLAARRELEREVVAKAVEVAAKILTEKSSAADQSTLFTSYIADLEQSASQTSDGGLS